MTTNRKEPSQLHQEAILEIKELRKKAEEAAKEKILLHLSPMIKEMMNVELENGMDLLSEQDEQDPLAAPGMDADAMPMADAPATDVPPATPPATPGDDSPMGVPNPSPTSTGEEPPISAGPTTPIPLPGPDGEITISFGQLFAGAPDAPGMETPDAAAMVPPAADAAPTPDAGMPMPTEPVAPATPSATPDSTGMPPATPDDAGTPPPTGAEPPMEEPKPEEVVQENLSMLEAIVNSATQTGYIAPLMRANVTAKVSEMFDITNTLRRDGFINEGKKLLTNRRLSMLVEQLEKIEHTYASRNTKTQDKQHVKTKNLSKFMNSLLEGHEGFGDGEKVKSGLNKVDGNAKTVDSHMKKASDSTIKDPGRGQLSLSEEEMSAMMDGESDEALEEALAIAEEALAGMAVKEEPWEEGKPMGEAKAKGKDDKKDKDKEKSKSDKKKSLKDRFKSLKEELDRTIAECGDMMDDVASPMSAMDAGHGITAVSAAPGETANINIKLTVDGATPVSVDADGEESADLDTDMGAEDLAMSDDEDVDDEMLELEMGGDEGEEPEGETLPLAENKVKNKQTAKLGSKAKSVVHAVIKENIALKRDLQDHEVVTACTSYLARIFARNNLTKDSKFAIASEMKKAKTVSECTAVYKRVNALIEKKVSEKKSETAKALTEGKQATPQVIAEQADGFWVHTTNRWSQLAGISENKTNVDFEKKDRFSGITKKDGK